MLHPHEVLCYMYTKSTDTFALDNDEARTFATQNGIPHSAVGTEGWNSLVDACEGICEVMFDDAP